MLLRSSLLKNILHTCQYSSTNTSYRSGVHKSSLDKIKDIQISYLAHTRLSRLSIKSQQAYSTDKYFVRFATCIYSLKLYMAFIIRFINKKTVILLKDKRHLIFQRYKIANSYGAIKTKGLKVHGTDLLFRTLMKMSHEGFSSCFAQI